MFDLLKEIYCEHKGYDMEAYREQEEERRKRRELRTVRIIVGGFLVLLFVLAIIGMRVSISEGNILGIIKYIVLGLSEITAVLFYFMKRKTLFYIFCGIILILSVIIFMI